MPALFTIGIVTYDRKELLKECVDSVIRQSFSNFNVIISNDFVENYITIDDIGINDPRITIINQESNLGPWKNHNFVLQESKSKYFCWLSDDDTIAENFLEIMNEALISFNYPRRIFSSYHSDKMLRATTRFPLTEEVIEMSGVDFLHSYLSSRLETIGHYGIFEREYLMSLGGLQNLGTGIHSPYNDNLLGIQSGKLDRIIFVDLPLVYFRKHSGSSSFSIVNLNDFFSAQNDFLDRSLEIINEPALDLKRSENVLNVIKWCIRDVFSVVRKNRRFLPKGFAWHVWLLYKRARGAGPYFRQFQLFLAKTAIRHISRQLKPKPPRSIADRKSN